MIIRIVSSLRLPPAVIQRGCGKGGIVENQRRAAVSYLFKSHFNSMPFYNKACGYRMFSKYVCQENSKFFKTPLVAKNTLLRNKMLNEKALLTRNVNFFSKLGKRKTVKSVAKRFKRLGSGALKRWRAGKNHNMRKKSSNQRRRLRKPVIVTGRQLRKLNKMISGW